MFFLSPLLLSVSLILKSLTVSLCDEIKKVHLTKFIALLLAIITSIGTFISMYIGKLIMTLLIPELSNIFGGILLSFIGIYLIIEYIRLKNKNAGFDTCYYFESSLKYKHILENPDIIEYGTPNNISIKKFLIPCFAIVLNNFSLCFAASITGININYSVFFNFIFTLFFIYFMHFNISIYISKWFSQYSNLVCGIIAIILGIFESFI